MSSNIVIGPSGDITFVYADALASLLTEGQASITRASNVEPAADGGWEADMAPSNGPVLRGPDGRGFALRSDALAAEVEWLNREVLNV